MGPRAGQSKQAAKALLRPRARASLGSSDGAGFWLVAGPGPLQQGGVEPAPSNYLSFREWAGARNTALASRISKPFI